MNTTELRTLHEAATPGPWWVCYYDAGDKLEYDNCPSVQAPEDHDCAVIHWDGFKQRHWVSANGNQRQIDANASLITYLRNAVPDILALIEERDRLREVAVDIAASLAAAISLLERGGKAAKKAAASDKMFDQMMLDYKASLDRARAALAGEQ